MRNLCDSLRRARICLLDRNDVSQAGLPETAAAQPLGVAACLPAGPKLTHPTELGAFFLAAQPSVDTLPSVARLLHSLSRSPRVFAWYPASQLLPSPRRACDPACDRCQFH